jgi:hypothetical protein
LNQSAGEDGDNLQKYALTGIPRKKSPPQLSRKGPSLKDFFSFTSSPKNSSILENDLISLLGIIISSPKTGMNLL